MHFTFVRTVGCRECVSNLNKMGEIQYCMHVTIILTRGKLFLNIDQKSMPFENDSVIVTK